MMYGYEVRIEHCDLENNYLTMMHVLSDVWKAYTYISWLKTRHHHTKGQNTAVLMHVAINIAQNIDFCDSKVAQWTLN